MLISNHQSPCTLRSYLQLVIYIIGACLKGVVIGPALELLCLYRRHCEHVDQPAGANGGVDQMCRLAKTQCDWAHLQQDDQREQ